MVKAKTPARKGKQEPISQAAWDRIKELPATGQLSYRPPELDGRRLRATGRTIQFNIKVKPEFRDEVFRLAAENGVGMAAMLERILAEWKGTGGGAG